MWPQRHVQVAIHIWQTSVCQHLRKGPVPAHVWACGVLQVLHAMSANHRSRVRGCLPSCASQKAAILRQSSHNQGALRAHRSTTSVLVAQQSVIRGPHCLRVLPCILSSKCGAHLGAGTQSSNREYIGLASVMMRRAGAARAGYLRTDTSIRLCLPATGLLLAAVACPAAGISDHKL